MKIYLGVDINYVNVDIASHIEDETFTKVFDCTNKILLDKEEFNTALAITNKYCRYFV